MLVSTIDQSLFEQIKQDQSLNVSFVDFVQHLHKILDSVTKRNDLHVTLSSAPSSNAAQTLQFYERRSFRNLVHLSLPIEQPSERYVLHYIQQSLFDTQRMCDGHALHLKRVQHDISQRDAQIADLRADIAKLSGRLQEEENRVLARNAEQVHRLQAEVKHLSEAREMDDRKHRHTVKTLQDTLDYKTKEAQSLADKLGQEVQRTEQLLVDLQQSKQSLRLGVEESERLRSEIAAHKAQDRKSEHMLAEQRKQLQDIGERLNAKEKHASDVQAELEAEKHIARTKRMALELATDEIARANSIIVKQSKELGQLAKKCDWRTEVALRQEQRMKGMETELEAMRATVRQTGQAAKENADVSGQLRELRDATDDINRKYGRSELQDHQLIGINLNGFVWFVIPEIQELRQQLHQVNAESKLNDCTNRYLNMTGRGGDQR